MRLLPTLSALLLIASTAAAQPAPDQPQDPAVQPPVAPQYQAPQPPASGQLGPHGHQPMKVRFEAANTTNDGKLTVDQARTAGMGMLVHNFDQIDAEHKGYITLQDIRAWHQARHAAKAAGQQ